MPQVPPASCPKCHEVLDGATNMTNDKILPAAGDMSVCIYCSTLLIFTPDLQLAKMTSADIDALSAKQAYELGRAQGAVIKFLLRQENVKGRG